MTMPKQQWQSYIIYLAKYYRTESSPYLNVYENKLKAGHHSPELFRAYRRTCIYVWSSYNIARHIIATITFMRSLKGCGYDW